MLQADSTATAWEARPFEGFSDNNLSAKLNAKMKRPGILQIIRMMNGTHTRQEIVRALASNGREGQVELSIDAVFYLLRECTAFLYTKRPEGVPVTERGSACSWNLFKSAT